MNADRPKEPKRAGLTCSNSSPEAGPLGNFIPEDECYHLGALPSTQLRLQDSGRSASGLDRHHLPLPLHCLQGINVQNLLIVLHQTRPVPNTPRAPKSSIVAPTSRRWSPLASLCQASLEYQPNLADEFFKSSVAMRIITNRGPSSVFGIFSWALEILMPCTLRVLSRSR